MWSFDWISNRWPDGKVTSSLHQFDIQYKMRIEDVLKIFSSPDLVILCCP